MSKAGVIARRISHRSVNGRDRDAEVADFAAGGQMFHFAALDRLRVAQTGGEHSRQVGIGAENFLVRAVAQSSNAQRFFRRWIGGADRSRGVHEQQARGHVASYFLREPLGFLRALLGQQMQAGQFFFLRSQFFDHALHGSGHECRSVFGIGLWAGPINIGRARTVAQDFANQNGEQRYAQQKDREQSYGVFEIERRMSGCRMCGDEREYDEGIHCYRTISND